VGKARARIGWSRREEGETVPLLAENVNFNVTPAQGGLLAAFIAIYVAILVVMIVAWVKIVSKAGYSGWWVLSAFVPFLGIVMFFVFAFSKWPVLQELRSLRAAAGPYGATATPTGLGTSASLPLQSEGPPPPPPPPG
jgi:hypothetical protein